MKIRSLIRIVSIVLIVLLVPFTIMQFSEGFNWKVGDFIMTGVLLTTLGVVIEFTFRKVKKLKYRIGIIVAFLAFILMIWLELAVGLIENIVSLIS